MPKETPQKLHYRIGELSSLLEVEPHVLRYWEQEFKLRPARSPSGQRMYARRDLERLLEIKRLLYDEGYTIAGARKALTREKSVSAPVGDAPGAAKNLGEVREHLERLRGVVRRARRRLVGAFPGQDSES